MTNRRSLLDDDDEMTPTQEHQSNVFDDEFEVEEDFDFVADGYRPGQSHDRHAERQSFQEDEAVRTVSAHYATGAVVSGVLSRNSTRKSRGVVNPFSSPEDGEELPLRRTPSGNFVPDVAHRSISSASSTHYAGSNSAGMGAEGPSHPYGMYPQGTVVRSSSTATASTARPTRQSSSRYAPGPQHPYALYPQGVGDDFNDDDDDDSSTPQNPVPVGFLGTQQFRRQRGPDGEEQDILGEYGHIEQLPPYTRYPEDGPEKAPLLDVPAPPGALHSRAPVLGTDPGMALMHTQIFPPQQRPQSMMDESDLQRQNSRLSRLSHVPDPPDDDETSAETSLLSKKSWGEKSWSERRKTRFCGCIPFWVVVSIIAVVVFAGGILGGALGGFAAGQKSGTKAAIAKAQSSTFYDASIITTATGVPPPTGTYPLSLGIPQETEQACLTQISDQAAWSCDLVGSDEIWISIESSPDGNDTGAYLFTKAGPDPSMQLSYGSQVSNMFTSFAPFYFVQDRDDMDDGPAFYFQQQYNKLVVVSQEAIDVHTQRLRRDAYGRWPSWIVQKQYATPGDKPWFCYWNNTIMEAFIYKNVPAVINPVLSGISPSMSGSTTSSSSSSTSSITSAATLPTDSSYQSHTAPWSIADVDPTATVTTTVSWATSTCTYSGIASDFPQWMESNYPNFEHYVSSGSNGGGSSPQIKPRSDDDDHSDGDGPFQYLVKIEERRLARSPAPMCVQYQVLDDYTWNVVTDENGAQITVTLGEADPPPFPRGRMAKGRGKRGLMPAGRCHCQWMSGE